MQSFKDWGELQRKSEPQDAKGRAQRSKGEEKNPQEMTTTSPCERCGAVR